MASGWLPTNFSASLALALLSMCCWGSWSNSSKAASASDVAFGHYYLDFSLGVWASTLLLFVTLGGASPWHDSPVDGASRIAAASCAGLVFNVANVLLVAGIQVAGLAVAFPVGIGTALVLGTLLTFAVDPHNNSAPLFFAGVAAAFAAILLQVAADGERERDRRPPAGAPPPASPRADADADGLECPADESRQALTTDAPPPPIAAGRQAGLAICATSGLLMALWSPLSAIAMRQEANGRCNGCLTPYGSMLMLTSAVLVSSPPICALLLRRPIVGAASSLGAYCALPATAHLYGLAGGATWAVGTCSNLISGASLGFALSYAIGQAAPMVATLWGLFYYREFAGAGRKCFLLVASSMTMYSAAIALVASSKGGSQT